MYTRFTSMDGRYPIAYYFDFRFGCNCFKLIKISELLSQKNKKIKNCESKLPCM